MKKEICKKLLKEQKFDELIITLEKEFVILYKEMIEYANKEEHTDDSLLNVGSLVIDYYPMYQDIVLENENVINSGEYDYGEIIDILLDSYAFLSKDYKKQIDKE